MFPIQLREAPAYAYIARKVNTTPHREKPNRELRQTSTANAGEPLHINDNKNHITYSSHRKPEVRLDQVAKRRNKMKGAISLLSKTVTGLRAVFLDNVSPARNRTTFGEGKGQRRAVADMLHSDLDSWHEYEQLASDTDNPTPQSPRNKTKGPSLDVWIDRLTVAIEDSFAAQAVFVGILP
ncbi:hypothetical protein F5B21DRAFT_502730 [Xylaria acuta]|nr:hypothetical protein F5B21DRAFT_502730 [Xylaria acuta]